VVIAFGQKLSAPLIADRFAINLHASLLPRWRGAAPINHAILAGDAETGNSVITIANRIDAGLVLHQTRRQIDPLVTAGELHDLLASDGPGAIDAVLRAHAAGSLAPHTQDESRVTRATKLSRADDWVDFSKPAGECRCRIHGLTPWPGISATIADQPVKVMRVQEVQPGTESRTGAPGAVVDGPGGIVACGDGTALRLLEIQPPGKRAMTWDEYLRGRSVPDGATVRSAGGNAC
jgi:methionyl-tRNA formyltransferase